MARKSGRAKEGPKEGPKERQKKSYAETRIITVHTAFIPAPDDKGVQLLVRIADTEGRTHNILPLDSPEENVRTFVSGRTLCIAKNSGGRWEFAPTPSGQNKTAPEAPQPVLL